MQSQKEDEEALTMRSQDERGRGEERASKDSGGGGRLERQDMHNLRGGLQGGRRHPRPTKMPPCVPQSLYRPVVRGVSTHSRLSIVQGAHSQLIEGRW
eukprot:scaffold462_cov195-Pinguiococcus_pyrenoidosus.AAC.82